MTMSDDVMAESGVLVPISVLALELRCDPSAIARRFVGSVCIDPTTGLQSIPAERSSVYLAAIRAAQQHSAEQQARRAAEATLPPARERVRRLQAAQALLGEAIDGGGLDTMKAVDGTLDRDLDRAAQTRAELLGQTPSQYHRIQED
jgi:hypothetical protein